MGIFEISSEFLLDPNGFNGITFDKSLFEGTPTISIQKINIFHFIHVKGKLKVDFKLAKTKTKEEVYAFVYLNSPFRFIPVDEDVESFNLKVTPYSYFSNSLEEETFLFDKEEEIEFFIFTVPKNNFLQHFSQGDKGEVFEIGKKGFMLFNPLTSTTLEKLHACTEQFGAFQSIKNLSIIYDLVYEAMSSFYARIEGKCIPQYYSSNDLDKTFRVQKYLEQNYESKSEPHDMEKVTGFGYSKLRKLFKEIFGVTILKYANDYKLDLAYKWLSEGTHNVSDCTYGLGFISVTHFGRMFKEKYGEPPSKIYKYS